MITRSVNCRAMATVSSVLSESTTTISSAQRTDSSAAAMLLASLRVMTVTVTFCTGNSVGQVGQPALPCLEERRRV